MTTQSNIKNAATAKRYAGALLSLARENGMLEEFDLDLTKVSDIFNSSDELKSALQHPAVPLDAKKDIISTLFSKEVSEKTMNFLYMLHEKNRFDILPSILDFYRDLKNKEQNILPLTITSAVEIPDKLKDILLKKLTGKFSKEIVPEYRIDKDIIAGLIIQSQDSVIDISYKNKFEEMKKQLI